MKRKNFLSLIGLGAGTVIISSCLGACGKSDGPSPSPSPNPTPDNKVDFTLDVSSNSDINSKGWTIQNGVIIAKNGLNYIALAAACTHQQNPVTYQASSNTFPCSLQDAAHGSVFDANGVKLKGPAIQNLAKFNTTLTGNTLRVYES
ncbi:QcrA and Rieske domain-containing protein [Daejeonella oryzae]|uniref:QcrA and Rieske domain-containing protein n=1 Tax=Daejeonella oryzae TaxID=1122943 RepID=UPI0004128E90|nr:Rieske 2Fe-2S domain-containing protein [Daejeonella oryzae]